MMTRATSLSVFGIVTLLVTGCGAGTARQADTTPPVPTATLDEPSSPFPGSPVEVTLGLRPTGGDTETMMQVDPRPGQPALVFRIDRLDHMCDDIRVYFDTDSAELGPRTRAALDTLADCYDSTQLRSIDVIGHADPRGTDAYNDDLAMRRARAVAAYLRDRGVTEPEMDVISRGERAARWRFYWPDDRRVEVQAHPRAGDEE